MLLHWEHWVGSDGTILGLNKGEATILATSQSDGSVTAEIKVTVVQLQEIQLRPT